MKITERGWYKLQGGNLVEVLYVNKYGALTVALHDKNDTLYAYHGDGTRSAYPDPMENIVERCLKTPSKLQIQKQRGELT